MFHQKSDVLAPCCIRIENLFHNFFFFSANLFLPLPKMVPDECDDHLDDDEHGNSDDDSSCVEAEFTSLTPFS